MEFSGSGKYLITCTGAPMGTISLRSALDYDMSKSSREADTFRNVSTMRAARGADLLALCDINSGLSIYSLRTLNKVRDLYPGTKHISCISFSSQGQFACACEDSSIKLWSIRSANESHT